MDDFAKETLPVALEEEMKRSYLDYAMSVIVGRALPDARDGLKPVHRRVLYAMHELGNDWNKPYKKSARVVGDVIGKYHPHGDAAVYDALVRMAQPFSMRYPLIDGQGNFGSVDGDAPAAMRYTEVRMAKIAHELLADLDQETVDFGPNYDGSEKEPLVLPGKIPNLLVNGASGIAVGMATNIPPHHLGEVVSAALYLLRHPEVEIDDLFEFLPAPDFPTGGLIYGLDGVREGYRTGRGKVIMRAKIHVEELERDRQAIIVDEIPYQVNKAHLLSRIADLIREKRIEGITDLRDESDKSGLRVVFELRRGENAEVLINQLYTLTGLEETFGMNFVALVDGQPKVLNIKALLECFLQHRREVVFRRSVYALRKARERGHVLEGLAVALANIDPLIACIKSAKTPQEAKEAILARSWAPGLVAALLARTDPFLLRPETMEERSGLIDDAYHFSEAQARAILELRLQRLTAMEQEAIIEELKTVMDTVTDLLDVLDRPERITQIIEAELKAINREFSDARKSVIIEETTNRREEDLISPEDMVVTFSRQGYIKAQAIDEYHTQRRGGRGKIATGTKEGDFIDSVFVAHSHDTLLCFTSSGRVFWLPVYKLPKGSRTAKGNPIHNLLPIGQEEWVTAILPVHHFDDEHYVFLATQKGVVKKIPLSELSRPRSSGLNAIDLDEGDYLQGASLTDGQRKILLVSNAGKAALFDETEVRPMGRAARGIRGIRLPDDKSQVISLLVSDERHPDILFVCEHGYGKRTAFEAFPLHGRGGQGVWAYKPSDRNGPVIGAVLVSENEDVVIMTSMGKLIRMPVKDIRAMSRAAAGVRLVALEKGETVCGIGRVEEQEEMEQES
jgi:DNA gyrase subunit A